MLQAVKNSTCDFLNFYKYPADMPVAGKYDIPVVKGIRIKHPEKLKVIAFDECHLIPKKERKQYIVHFYIYDYKFERVWTYINKNTEYLKQFKGLSHLTSLNTWICQELCKSGIYGDVTSWHTGGKVMVFL